MATFPAIAIDQSSKYKRTPRRKTTQFGDGYSQKYGDGINPYSETWDLSFSLRTAASITTLSNFLDANQSIPFDWQAPLDASSKKWTMTDQGYSVTNPERDLYSISFTIERYFGV